MYNFACDVNIYLFLGISFYIEWKKSNVMDIHNSHEFNDLQMLVFRKVSKSI